MSRQGDRSENKPSKNFKLLGFWYVFVYCANILYFSSFLFDNPFGPTL